MSEAAFCERRGEHTYNMIGLCLACGARRGDSTVPVVEKPRGKPGRPRKNTPPSVVRGET